MSTKWLDRTERLRLHTLLLVCFAIVHLPFVSGSCRGPSEWASRSIYSLMTDRFSPTDSAGGDACRQGNLVNSSYCGGTFQGVTNHLDYIQGMGFEAIWISPIIENVPHGYHGYWPLNLHVVNPHFSTNGTSEAAERELKTLIQAAHARDMYVMLDVVPNHMGGPTMLRSPYTNFYPFNDSGHYHQVCHLPDLCNQDDTDYFCTIPLDAYSIKSGESHNETLCQEKNKSAVEMCNEAPGLIDLNQTNPFVRNELLHRLRHAIEEYGFDGIRADSFKHVPISFSRDYKEATTCFLLGEASVRNDPCFLAQYQQQGAADGLMSYPMAYTLQSVFGASRQPMALLSRRFHGYKDVIPNLRFFGTFFDNHDLDRFHTINPDVQAAKNVLTYTFLSEGIPIVYYGTEQGYEGTMSTQMNRAPLWWSNFDTSHILYDFISIVNRCRKANKAWQYDQEEVLYTYGLYIFTRGPLLVVLTNQKMGLEHNLTLGMHNFKHLDRVCDCLRPFDCQVVQKSGVLSVQVHNGEPKIYALNLH